jgi:hypothetical protein
MLRWFRPRWVMLVIQHEGLSAFHHRLYLTPLLLSRRNLAVWHPFFYRELHQTFVEFTKSERWISGYS